MNEDRLKIGFAGTGKMGLPICLRLAEAGHEITVLTSPRAPARLAPELAAAGCQAVTRGRDLAGKIEVLATCLPSSREVEQVLLGQEGLFAGLRNDKQTGLMHIDHTGGDPATTRALALKWKAYGGTLVDAAISGTPELAQSGGLKLLCGGTAEDVEHLERIAPAYATSIIHAGETGAGHMLRLIGGLMGYGIAMLSSEAFLVCSAAGIQPATLTAMITGTGADSRTFQAMAAAEIAGLNATARRKLSIETVVKDLRALIMQAEVMGCLVPVATEITEQMALAAAIGGPEAAISNLTQCLRSLSKTDL